jgi:hypothetical protein
MLEYVRDTLRAAQAKPIDCSKHGLICERSARELRVNSSRKSAPALDRANH